MNLLKNIKKWYKETDPFELIAIIFIIIGIVAIILVFFTSSFHEFFDETKHDLTHYAELIGGFVGSLWALAGVLLFYASLASQKSELEEQKNLLVKQIDEVVKQTQEFRKQSDIQAKQQYENTYFQLLRFHNEIITSIVLEITDVDFMTGTNTIRQINGRKSFVEYYDIYKRFFNTQLEILMTGELTLPVVQRIVDNSYRQFFDEYQADLGHYFRNLFNVLYFIDNLEDEEKSNFYLELLHAQLSNYELALLYFHCASSNNSAFKILLEKYELLATIPDDEIISMSKRLYNPKAFGKDDFDNDDDMNYGGGDISASDFSMQENNFNLNDTDLSFSENDILSKFASLTKKQKNNDDSSDFKDDFSNLDFSDNYNNDFNFNFDDLNETGEEIDSSLDKLRQNFDKNKNNPKNEDLKGILNNTQLENISHSHINDNLLGDLAAKLKKQVANNNQSNEDDLWGFDDFDINDFKVNDLDNNLEINDIDDVKDFNDTNTTNQLEENKILDNSEINKIDNKEFNILEKLKKMSDLDSNKNNDDFDLSNLDGFGDYDDYDDYDDDDVENVIENEYDKEQDKEQDKDTDIFTSKFDNILKSNNLDNSNNENSFEIDEQDNLNEIKKKLSQNKIITKEIESNDINPVTTTTKTINIDKEEKFEKKLTNLSKLIQKRR